MLAQCLSAASAIINCVIDRILPSEAIRYCPEYYFALSAFGTAVLMKVRSIARDDARTAY
jgi:hypothetical protein